MECRYINQPNTMPKLPEKQRKYFIVRTSTLNPTGETVFCVPSKVQRMSAQMGVKFMRHLPKEKHPQPIQPETATTQN